MVGLSDDDPHRIVLRKGSLVTGLPNSDGASVIQRSNESFVQSTWLHLRLDMIVNDNGDVVLRNAHERFIAELERTRELIREDEIRRQRKA